MISRPMLEVKQFKNAGVMGSGREKHEELARPLASRWPTCFPEVEVEVE